jgi:hypothetical protein
MQKIVLWKASTVALAGALAFVIATSDNVASADSQPHMKTALATLKVAKSQLEKATHDKGGHRAKALQLTEQAMEQVKKGIEFDNKHDARDDASAPLTQ